MTATRRIFVLKIWILTFVTIVLGAIILSIGWKTISDILIHSAKQEINSVLRFAAAQSIYYADQSVSGDISREEAEYKVTELLSQMRFGTNYIWANDNHAIARVHIRDDVIGTFQQSYMRHRSFITSPSDIAFEVDSNLKPVVDKKILKINGVILIPEWDWIIGYGLYFDDMNRIIWSHFKMLLITVCASLSFLWCLTLGLVIRTERSRR